MLIMSVDLGLKRTGIALSDESMSFAFPKGVITEYSSERLIEKIILKAKELSAEKIVVGLPVNMDGSHGERAETCAEIGKKIEEMSGIPVVLWDERCTTVLAHNTMNENNVRGKKRKEVIDSVAAVFILESYLGFLKSDN